MIVAFIGTIMLILKLKKKIPPKIRIDISTAKRRAVHEMKNDEDNEWTACSSSCNNVSCSSGNV